MVVVISAVGILFSGIALAGVGQILRAIVDTADNTRQMVDRMQD
jgi:hypothetical protein